MDTPAQTFGERRAELKRTYYKRLSISEIDDMLNLKLGNDPLRDEIIDRLIAADSK